MSDFPFHECVATAQEVIAAGGTIYQKFTCGKCGARQTMTDSNKFYTGGKCEECGYTTDLKIMGCNYMVVFSRGAKEST